MGPVYLYMPMCIFCYLRPGILDKGVFYFFQMPTNNQRLYLRMHFNKHLFLCQGNTRILGTEVDMTCELEQREDVELVAGHKFSLLSGVGLVSTESL